MPPDPSDCGILIEVSVGPKGQPGGETFGVVVCTPLWLAHRVRPGDYLFTRHHLMVHRFDFGVIRNALYKMFNGQ